MLEILFVVFIYKKLKKRLADRNQNTKRAWIGPACWLGGELAGGMLAATAVDLSRLIGKGTALTSLGAFPYLFALFCAAVCSAIAFIALYRLPPKTLSCPKCGLAFKGNATFGITCESCQTRLKVVDGKVQPLETI